MNDDKRCLTMAIQTLAEVGIHSPEIARGSKHIQLRWVNPRGERRVFAVAGTPSDWRSPQNTVRDLRRILREDGMLDISEPRLPPPRQPSQLELLERRVVELERRLGISTREESGCRPREVKSTRQA